MKLVVMIPAYNEERTIGEVIREIPKSMDGIDSIGILVIDDGSTDRTKTTAEQAGATSVISHQENRGLAAAFRTGLEAALRMHADIIVNTDADMQYDQRQIPRLIRPILDNTADVVLGSRFKGYIEEMPMRKKLGNLIATRLTRLLAGFNTSDAQSGFRAYSRQSASLLRITGKKTYVQEGIIRPARMGFRLVETPITFHKRSGKSRLVKSIWSYAFSVFPDMISCYIDAVTSPSPRRHRTHPASSLS